MRLKIHRGAEEIGGNCIEVESKGYRIIFDIGLPIEVDLNEKDFKNYLPIVEGLNGNSKTLKSIIISHPHLDHYGLLKYVSPTIPIAIGKSAWNIINTASYFQKDKWKLPPLTFTLENRKTFMIGHFKITPYLVDHSAYDAYSLLIEADGQSFFYSGDFRLHGRKSSLMEELINNPPKDIDLLLMEGTNISDSSRQKSTISENDLLEVFTREFKVTQGLSLIQTSTQNIDRIVTIFKACKMAKKSLVIDLYTALILEATGKSSIPQSFWEGVELYLPISQRKQVIDQKLFNELKLHSKNRIYLEDLLSSPQNKVLIFRPSMLMDFRKEKDLFDGAKFIYSLWEGYWNRESNQSFRNWLESYNIPKISIHTSGHVHPEDWIKFGQGLNPKSIIPIHTLGKEKYKEYFNNVIEYTEGEWHEI